MRKVVQVWFHPWLWLLLLMAAASLFSRALLSFSTALLAIVCLTQTHWRTFFVQLRKEPAAWCMLLLFFIPALSGLGSSDINTWAVLMLIKLPYLFMPLAFFAMPPVTEKQWQQWVGLLLLLLVGACLWSVLHYVPQMQSIHQSYLSAKTLPVLMDNDHLRFSWLLSVGMLGALRGWDTAEHKLHRRLALAAVLLIFMFLHLLAARTGLLLAYFFGLGYVLTQRRFGSRRYNVLAFMLIIAVAIVALLSVPTLQNRWKYLRYTYQHGVGNYLPGSTDGNRWLSLRAGWEVLQQHPWGVGLGDVRSVIFQWYDTHYPGMQETDKQFPANEWLVHGCAAGWPGVLLFTVALVAPFFSPVFRKNIWGTLLLAGNIGIALTDSSMEGQLGIFIHTFTLLWWWQWLRLK